MSAPYKKEDTKVGAAKAEADSKQSQKVKTPVNPKTGCPFLIGGTFNNSAEVASIYDNLFRGIGGVNGQWLGSPDQTKRVPRKLPIPAVSEAEVLALGLDENGKRILLEARIKDYPRNLEAYQRNMQDQIQVILDAFYSQEDKEKMKKSDVYIAETNPTIFSPNPASVWNW